MKTFTEALRYHPGLTGAATIQSENNFHFTIKGPAKKAYINVRKYMDRSISTLSSVVDEHNHAIPISTGFSEITKSYDLQDLAACDIVDNEESYKYIFSTLCLLTDGRFKSHATTKLGDLIFLQNPGAVMVNNVCNELDDLHDHDAHAKVYIHQENGLNPFVEIQTPRFMDGVLFRLLGTHVMGHNESEIMVTPQLVFDNHYLKEPKITVVDMEAATLRTDERFLVDFQQLLMEMAKKAVEYD